MVVDSGDSRQTVPIGFRERHADTGVVAYQLQSCSTDLDCSDPMISEKWYFKTFSRLFVEIGKIHRVALLNKSAESKILPNQYSRIGTYYYSATQCCVFSSIIFTKELNTKIQNENGILWRMTFCQKPGRFASLGCERGITGFSLRI